MHGTGVAGTGWTECRPHQSNACIPQRVTHACAMRRGFRLMPPQRSLLHAGGPKRVRIWRQFIWIPGYCPIASGSEERCLGDDALVEDAPKDCEDCGDWHSEDCTPWPSNP